jgi:YVTN family beta-propeller protein
MVMVGAIAAEAAPFAYVTNNGGSNVSVIDTATNTVAAMVSGDVGPLGVAITPNGAFAYVANTNSGTVSVIDTNPLSPKERSLNISRDRRSAGIVADRESYGHRICGRKIAGSCAFGSEREAITALGDDDNFKRHAIEDPIEDKPVWILLE